MIIHKLNRHDLVFVKEFPRLTLSRQPITVKPSSLQPDPKKGKLFYNELQIHKFKKTRKRKTEGLQSPSKYEADPRIRYNPKM